MCVYKSIHYVCVYVYFLVFAHVLFSLEGEFFLHVCAFFEGVLL